MTDIKTSDTILCDLSGITNFTEIKDLLANGVIDIGLLKLGGYWNICLRKEPLLTKIMFGLFATTKGFEDDMDNNVLPSYGIPTYVLSKNIIILTLSLVFGPITEKSLPEVKAMAKEKMAL